MSSVDREDPDAEVAADDGLVDEYADKAARGMEPVRRRGFPMVFEDHDDLMDLLSGEVDGEYHGE